MYQQRDFRGRVRLGPDENQRKGLGGNEDFKEGMFLQEDCQPTDSLRENSKHIRWLRICCLGETLE
jgi:hypothetical protein